MNILLIGNEGYLGRGLFAFLSQKHKVIGWDLKENLFELNNTILEQHSIDIVINLAVVASFADKYQAGDPTDKVNVAGARHLVKLLKGSNIAWFQLSTREVFGPVYSPEDVIQTENGFRPKFLVKEATPYAPQNFYGKSKLMAEFISESHPRSNIIRLTTCYTDFAAPNGNWVVNLIDSCINNRPVKLTQKGGLQFRDPLHTDDLGRLIELLYQKEIFSERIHAGGGEHNMISLREFVLIANPNTKIQSSEGGDFGFAYDIAKATNLTGWKPKIRVREKIPVIAENIRSGVTE
tara:strand:+ start:1095 stop:1973 length:879 start_codon:yes stop_codon:yes gene_type:complete